MQFNLPPITNISEEDTVEILESAKESDPVLSISQLTEKLNSILYNYVLGIYARTIHSSPSQLAQSFKQIHSSTKKLEQLLKGKIGKTAIPPAETLEKIPSRELIEMKFWLHQNKVSGPVFHNLMSDLELLEKISDELASKFSAATLDTTMKSRNTRNLVINRLYQQIYDLWKEAFNKTPAITSSDVGCPITKFIHALLEKIVEKNRSTPEFNNLFDIPIPTYSSIGSRLRRLSSNDPS